MERSQARLLIDLRFLTYRLQPVCLFCLSAAYPNGQCRPNAFCWISVSRRIPVRASLSMALSCFSVKVASLRVTLSVRVLPSASSSSQR